MRPMVRARWLAAMTPGRGPEFDDEDRPFAGALEGQDPAAALHDEQLRADTSGAQPLLDATRGTPGRSAGSRR